MLTGARPGARGCRKALKSQVRGEGAPAAFIFSSMHLLTISARLSRFSCALPFSVRIQHSRAARECVIGSEFVTGPACIRGASPSGLAGATAVVASPLVGPVESVSQPASPSAQAVSKTTRAVEELARISRPQTSSHAFSALDFDW